MTFDWTTAGLLRKFAPLADEVTVKGTLACPSCSFAWNDYRTIEGMKIPNVLREVIGKTSQGYELVCGHASRPLTRFHREEFVSDADLGEAMIELLRAE